MKRIFLFVLTNLAIMVMISIVLAVLGVTGYITPDGLNYSALMVVSLVWGFGGALISLAMSRWMAKTAMGVQLVNGRTGQAELDWLYQTVEQLTRSEEHTSELQSQSNLVCRLLLEKKKKNKKSQQLA